MPFISAQAAMPEITRDRVVYEFAQAKPSAPTGLRLSSPGMNSLVDPNTTNSLQALFSLPQTVRILAPTNVLSSELLGLSTTSPLRDVVSLSAISRGPRPIQYVGLLLDGEIIASITDQALPKLGQLKLQIDTRLIANGEHTLALRVLDRGLDANGEESYDKHETEPVKVKFDNDLWVKNWYGDVEQKLVLDLGTKFKSGSVEATISDQEGKELFHVKRQLELSNGSGRAKIVFPDDPASPPPYALGYKKFEIKVVVVDTEKPTPEHHLMNLLLPCKR